MMDAELPFIVRRWGSDSSVQPVDERVLRLSEAIDLARSLAMKENTRTAMVLDDQSMEWAKFNMLWMIPEEYR